MTDTPERSLEDVERLEQAARIVAAYVSHNVLPAGALPKLISDTHTVLRSLGTANMQSAVDELTPVVPIKKSVTPDFIICLDDGKKFKSLKRHLTQLGMTPATYRAKWGLPENYPMVAPNYSAARASLAKSNGLGRKPVAKSTAVAKASKSATKTRR